MTIKELCLIYRALLRECELMETTAKCKAEEETKARDIYFRIKEDDTANQAEKNEVEKMYHEAIDKKREADAALNDMEEAAKEFESYTVSFEVC